MKIVRLHRCILQIAYIRALDVSLDSNYFFIFFFKKIVKESLIKLER